jgi:hypothetical protein
MTHKRAIVLLVLAACGGTPEPAARGTSPASTDTVAEGTVRMAGPRESAQMVLSGTAPDIALVGSLAGELGRLVGARVSVTGRPTANPAAVPERAVDVASYDIIAVNGERPYVGMLVERDRRLWLAGRDTLELVGAPSDLVARVGAKVFVNGTVQAGQLLLRSYGVILEPVR